jgi:zinc transport system substrate-binding protein
MNPPAFPSWQPFCRGLAAAALVAVHAAPCRAGDESPPGVVAGSAMIAAAVRGLADEQRVALVELQPPGACPGHFDLSPQLLRRVRRAALVIHHDYQQQLAARLAAADDGPRFLPIQSDGSLCLPEHQRALLGHLATALEPLLDPAGRQEMRWRRAKLEEEIRVVAAEIAAAAGQWADRPVVASGMQREFVERLGLRVVAELRRPEALGPRDWARMRGAGAALVIGNLQSDAAAAQALAKQAGLPVVVLSNFPGAEGFGADYAALVRANLGRIAAAWSTP